MMGAGSAAPVFAGSPKGVTFSTSTTTTNALATTTVTLPRSSKPIRLLVSVTPGASANIQVQGNGVEFYAGSCSPNLPLSLPLTGFPETTTLNVQYIIYCTTTAYINGTLFYT